MFLMCTPSSTLGQGRGQNVVCASDSYGKKRMNPGRPYIQTCLLGLNSAVFSDCQKYRYRLDRIWNDSLPPLAFGMLNPSTADHERNDPTIERCQRRAEASGFGRLIVWNLFAFRASNPSALRKQVDPIGPNNDDFIREALIETKDRGGRVIVGWGTNGSILNRHSAILDIAQSLSVELYCLGVTAGGYPKHPLYISYQSRPKCWQVS